MMMMMMMMMIMTYVIKIVIMLIIMILLIPTLYMYVCIYIYICIYTHIHTYIAACTRPVFKVRIWKIGPRLSGFGHLKGVSRSNQDMILGFETLTLKSRALDSREPTVRAGKRGRYLMRRTRRIRTASPHTKNPHVHSESPSRIFFEIPYGPRNPSP